MENLTELISNIFVSKKLDKKIKNHKKEEVLDDVMETPIKEELSKLQSIKSKKLKSANTECEEETIKNKKKNMEEDNVENKSEKIEDLENVEIIQDHKQINNLSSIKSSDSLSSLTSNISSSSDNSISSSNSSSDSSSSSSSSNSSIGSSSSSSSDSSSGGSGSETSDSSDSSDKSKSSMDSIKIVKDINKIILKASELCGKNMMIINHEFSKNLEIVSDVLFKLSKMSNVDDVYDKTLHIFAFADNKKDFRDILLENPHLYFTNFKIKSNLSEYKSDININKKQIIIVDFNLVSDIEKLSKFMRDDIQLIVLYNTYNYNVIDVYKFLGKSALLINKKDRLKLLQHRFYSKIIKYICEVDNYLDIINDENLDVKMLIIKNNQLRYN